MKRKLNIVRRFSEDIKKDVVNEFESGKSSVSELSKLYQVSCWSIYNWIEKYGSFAKQGIQIVEKKMSQTEKIKSLEQRIKELERIVGQKQIALDFHQKMIELAEEEYNISIKKKCSTPQSTGLGQTKKK